MFFAFRCCWGLFAKSGAQFYNQRMNKRKVLVIPSLVILSVTECASGVACEMFENPGSSTVPAATSQGLCGHLEDVFAPHSHNDAETDNPTTISYLSASGGSNVSARMWRSNFTVAQPETREPRFVIRL
jgi:hypothetical protein